jgi:hypothetical protein
MGNSGDDLWTEFGVGVNFNLMDGKLNPAYSPGCVNGRSLPFWEGSSAA